MQQVLNQVAEIAQKLASVIWQVLQFIWQWSFGQVARMLNLNFGTLPIWKQVLYVVVIAAMAYLLYRIVKDLMEAMKKVLQAIVGLISALIGMLPEIVWLGLIAFGGAWLITTLSIPWLP